jgi:tetratricopeptide (TPR) repeat protein
VVGSANPNAPSGCSQALEADPKNRLALEGMLALAEAAAMAASCAAACARSPSWPKTARSACATTGAWRSPRATWPSISSSPSHAYREVLRVEPEDLPVLGELTALERRRSDMAGLAGRSSSARGSLNSWATNAWRPPRCASSVRCSTFASAAQGEALVWLEKAARPPRAERAARAGDALSAPRACRLNARRALEDTLALLPKHAPPEKLAEVRGRLGRACELLGDKDAARENYALAFPLRRLDDELSGRLEALYVEGGFTRELTDLWASRAQALLQAGRATTPRPCSSRPHRLQLELGDATGAMLRLTSALDASPSGDKAREVLEAMAKLELERGEPIEASRLLPRRAQVAKDPRESARWSPSRPLRWCARPRASRPCCCKRSSTTSATRLPACAAAS